MTFYAELDSLIYLIIYAIKWWKLSYLFYLFKFALLDDKLYRINVHDCDVLNTNAEAHTNETIENTQGNSTRTSYKYEDAY